MRALGRGSISSFLKLSVDIVWVAACAGLGFVWIIVAMSVFSMANDSATIPGFERIVAGGTEELIEWTLRWSVLFIGAMMVCAYLRGVFGTLVAGDPFVPENARRLRMIAIVVGAAEVIRLLIGVVVPLLGVGLGLEHSGERAITIGFDAGVWLSVLTLFVLSQVFTEGAALREDQQMTI